MTNLLYLLDNHAGLDAEAHGFVSMAQSELARVSHIVKQSLSYYRGDTADREFDLAVVVEESLNLFAERLDRSGIQLKSKLRAGARMVGHAGEIRQVFDNLLLNAIEAMPGGGRLTVAVHGPRSWKPTVAPRVRLTVADTGCGIPQAHVAQVFEPFFTTKPEKGTGLGLWVVQNIISKHHGSIRVRSSDAPGRSGTLIAVDWPAAKLQPTPERAHSESAA